MNAADSFATRSCVPCGTTEIAFRRQHSQQKINMCVQDVRIIEPTIPFKHKTKATKGRLFTIIGMVPPRAHRFSIDFYIGDKDDERALHLDNRFDKKTIVRNSFFEKAWGREEKQGGFPLAQGQPFELMILVDESQFSIAYNGTHYAEYEHRQPASNIDSIAINGDVVVSSYSETQVSNYLSKVPPQKQGQRLKETGHEMWKHVYDLPNGVPDSSELRIVGIANGSFFFNLTDNITSKDVVGLHLNYRHRINKVMLNSLFKGKWEAEIRPTQISFEVGRHFDLAISATKKELRIQQVGSPAAFFPLRHHFANDLKHLIVDGDVHLVWLSLEDTTNDE